MLCAYALDMQQDNIVPPLSPVTQSSLLSFTELFSFMMTPDASVTPDTPPSPHAYRAASSAGNAQELSTSVFVLVKWMCAEVFVFLWKMCVDTVYIPCSWRCAPP